MSLLKLFLDEKPAGEIVLRSTIPLDRALLCLDCNSIFEAEGEQKCPACGSGHAWPIAKRLSREPEPLTEEIPA
jgi:rubrerythrin